MSWLSQAAMNFTSGLIQRTFANLETNPNKVLEVKAEMYSDRTVHCREEELVLYGPSASSKDRYEIILNRPCSETVHQAYSLYRSTSNQDAEIRFLTLKDKVPFIVSISREVCNLAGIQKLCDAVQENPAWTAAHIAAYFSLLDCFQNPKIISLLSVPDVTSGKTVLQVAIETKNLRTVQTLVSAKASLEQLDNEANTVFHYAAHTSKEIISVLSEQSTKCLDYRNARGHTPLHVACLADKPDCVKALLLAGADVNIAASKVSDQPDSSMSTPGYVGTFLHENPHKLHAQDMKFGGTPLHWSCSREVIDTLIEMGCNINSTNFDGRTALHVMVLRNRLPCVVALLSHNAKTAIGDNEGNTPLHLAVTLGNIAVVQALVVFGTPADLAYKNNIGQTARHLVPTDAVGEQILHIVHSVGALRCPPDAVGCSEGCQHVDEGKNGVPPPSIMCAESRDILDQMLSVNGTKKARATRGKKSTKGGRLLCLDGGGIRGLVLVSLLIELEELLGRPIVHCFDWMAGTSTGGILALCLAAGKSLKECRCLYFRMKEMAFVGSRPYGSEPLEAILKEALGTDTVMSDITHPKLMISAVLADRKPCALCLFRNYPSASDILEVKPVGPEVFKPPPSPCETYLWRAARASGAAPTYFRAFGRYLDGGLIANNPTLDALTEIAEYNQALEATGRAAECTPPTVVVSVGTGLIPVTEMKSIDVFRPDSLWDTARLYMSVTALGTLLVDQATASDGRVVDRARAMCSLMGVPYFRFTPQMSEDITMDEKSDEKLVNMLWETKAYAHGNLSQLREVAEYLNCDEPMDV